MNIDRTNIFFKKDIQNNFLRIYKNKTDFLQKYYKNFAFGLRKIQRQKKGISGILYSLLSDCHFSNPDVAIRL